MFSFASGKLSMAWRASASEVASMISAAPGRSLRRHMLRTTPAAYNSRTRSPSAARRSGVHSSAGNWSVFRSVKTRNCILFSVHAALGCLLRPLVEGRRYNLRLHHLPANLNSNIRSEFGVFNRHVGQCNVLLEERCRRSASDLAEPLAVERKHWIPITPDATLNHLEPDQLSFWPTLFLNPEQRIAPNEVALVELRVAPESSLKDI